MGSQSPLRLAILMADTPMPGTQARFKSYGGVFTHLFERAAAPDLLSSHVSVASYDVVGDPSSYPALDDVDAVLITGSRHSAFEDDPWILALVEFARMAIADGRVRVVGVCFGHQICGRAMGVPVQRSPGGWEVSVMDVRLSDEGREFFGMEKMRIQQMHRDAVLSYPAHAIPLGDSDACQVQGMLIPGKVVTVQGHPEFTNEIMREILETRYKQQIFSEDLFKSGMDRAANDHDGVAIAKAFLRFMKEGS